MSGGNSAKIDNGNNKITEIGIGTISVGKGRPEQGDSNAIGPIYRSQVAKTSWPTIPNVTTLYDLFERSVRKNPQRRCIGWRPIQNGSAGPYTFHTYKETQERVKNVASALKAVKAGPHDKVGMYAINCPEWMLVLQACNRNTHYCVPLYDSLGESSVEYIIGHSEASIVFTSTQKFPLLEKTLHKTKEFIKTIVYFGDVTDDSKRTSQAAEKEGVKVYSFADFEQIGIDNPAEPSPPKAQDAACIMYTSGTTGNPKGVLLTHHTLVTAVASLQGFVDLGNIKLGPDDSFLSFLTLAHIFDRVVEEFILSVGGHIGYWQGDVKKVTDDVAALRPSIFAAVPRVLDRMKSGIEAKIKRQPSWKQGLFRTAYNIKRVMRRLGRFDFLSPLIDRTVLKSVKAAFGGRVRFVVSGGAPLGPSVETFLNITLCCPVLQGYGLTETCAASFLAGPFPGHSGTVGPPVPGTEYRLEGSSELGYNPNGSPPRGEICIRGPLLFKEYYKDAKKTEEAMDSEGFFHTGDVGEFTSAGCLKVIDRLKNMFKLAQGEYIAAEKLEVDFASCDLVEQIWVYGNSYESFLVAVVIPEKKEVQAFAKQQGISGEYSTLLTNDKVRKYVMEEVNKAGKSKKLRGFEMIKSVWLDEEAWSVDNDLMTPSFKLKRPQLQKHYQKKIDEMYKEAKKGM